LDCPHPHTLTKCQGKTLGLPSKGQNLITNIAKYMAGNSLPPSALLHKQQEEEENSNYSSAIWSPKLGGWGDKRNSEE
jgi:hypothetical protein